uniref:GP-PDE domain-containing protein n=1 Tax=Timema poppense TaxID=170557 RepID=A0A7R9DLP0_TIMPO|nr:unnamed protein product [Timema poppensis]
MAGHLLIVWNCVKAWFYFHAFFSFASEVVYCSVPYIFIGSLLFFALIYFAKVPAPSASIVEEILGKDPYYEEVSGEDQNEITHRYSMKVVAHRGAGLDAPENSISAFKLAKEKGCTAVEFDLTLTADNMPIIFHDTSVERVTLRTGNIQEMMWADIKKLDIAAKHPFNYESYNGTVGASRPRYKNLFKHLAAQWLDVVHGWLLEHFHYYLIGLSAILLQKDIVNMHVVSHWRDRGLRVIPWTVNLPLEKQFFSRVLKLTYMTDTLLAVSDDLKPRVSRQSTREIHESTTNEPNQLFKLQPKKDSTTNEPHELDS